VVDVVSSCKDSGSDEFGHFFEVKLEMFDGPIDLLLHLVKMNELPIEKLALAEITAQYLACIERARQFDLEVAGEYLVIAATLLSIKSSVLLNEPVELVEDEEGNLVDPHEELLRRLREAEVYRQGAADLSCREVLGVDVFAAIPSLSQFEPPPVTFKDHDPMLLGKAFAKLLQQAGSSVAEMTIRFEAISIVDRMMTVLDTLKKCGGRIVFYKLVPDLTSRSSIIGSFVALLELCKRQAIRVQQDESFKEIVIVLASAEVDATGLSSEFDQPASATANG
jgi:segregation and condensation protein A